MGNPAIHTGRIITLVPRCVFDTNAVVSALLFSRSVPRQALSRALHIGTLLMSQALSGELDEVLDRPRFDRYVTRQQRAAFLRNLLRMAMSVPITETVRACRDPKDDKILELAVNGNANYIITGDDDLLVMNPFRGIAIIGPAEFLEIAAFGV